MDPNETLARIRAMVSHSLGCNQEDCVCDPHELAELVQAMDERLSGGGSSPRGWESLTDSPAQVTPQEAWQHGRMHGPDVDCKICASLSPS